MSRLVVLQGGLQPRARLMVLVHGLYTASNMLAGSFLSIFLWRTGHDLGPIAIFTWVMAGSIPAAFLANAVLFRRSGAPPSIRTGLALNGIVYLSILVLGSSAPRWIVPLGMLRGLGEGFYWAGYHLATYDSTCERDRDHYFGALGVVNSLLSALLPPIAGAVIVLGAHADGIYRGYQLVFGLSGVLLVSGMLLAGKLRCGPRPAFSLRRMLSLAERNPAWHSVTRAKLAEGLSGMLAGLVLTVLAYNILKSEAGVGDFNGAMAALTTAVSLGLAVLMRPRYRVPCAMVGAGLLVVSTLLLPLYLSAWGLLVYGLLRAIGGPLNNNAMAPMALTVIDQDPEARALRYEYIVSQEVCLAIGRLLSIGCFVLIAIPVDQVLLVRIAVVVAGAGPMLIWAAFARTAQRLLGDAQPEGLRAAA